MVEGERYENALPPGSMLEEYRIEAVLGRGGFGITYLGYDTRLATRVAIKEYFPSDFAHRRGDGTVISAATSTVEDYTWGLDRFREEARTLARFRHPNIVSVYRFIEAHGTAYLVMEYLDGDTVAALIKERRAEFTPDDLDALLSAILSGLSVVHGGGILHRDIKPANIAIRRDGTPVLFDFGSARQALGQHSKGLTAVVSFGYSPIEQYSAKGRQGPWTDIYALGAVMYACLTGAPPPDATDRVRDDPYVPAVKLGRERFSESLLRAIDWALKFDEKERPQSIEEWQKSLHGEPGTASEPKAPAAVHRSGPSRQWIAAVAALVIVAVAAGGWAYWDYRADVERAASERAEQKAREDAQSRAQATAAEEARRKSDAEALRAREEEATHARSVPAEEPRPADGTESARPRVEPEGPSIKAVSDINKDQPASPTPDQQAAASDVNKDKPASPTPDQQAAVRVPAPTKSIAWKGATNAAYRGELKSPARGEPYRIVTRFNLRNDTLTGSYTYYEDRVEVNGTLDQFRETAPGKATFRWRDRYGEGTLRLSFGADMQSFHADWDVSGHPGLNGTWSGRR